MTSPSTSNDWQNLPEAIRRQFVSASSQTSTNGRLVYRALDTLTLRQTAIKISLHANATQYQALESEFIRLQALDHRNIVRALEIFRNERGQPVAFSMEWLEGRSPMPWVWRDVVDEELQSGADLQTLDFEDRLLNEARIHLSGPLPPLLENDLDVHVLSSRGRERFEHMASQLFDVITYLREQGTIHGDIKHSNIRIEDGGRLVLFDFGAVPATGERSEAFQLTPEYAAPEVLRGERPSFSSDLFSAAVVLFETATRRRFCASSRKSYHFRLRELRRSGVDIPLARGIATCLSSDPSERPLASEFQRWFARRRLRLLDASKDNLIKQSTQERLADDISRRLRLTPKELTLLIGEAGTAKSTIISHIAGDWVQQPNSYVIWVNGYAYSNENFQALRGLSQGLEDAYRAINDPELHRIWHEAMADPAFRALLRRSDTYDEQQDDVPLHADTQTRLRILNRIVGLFERIAIKNQLLVVFDDVQWLDTDSQQAFHQMLSQPREPRLRFLIATRPSLDLTRFRELSAIAGRSINEQIILPLSRQDQRLLVEDILGEPPTDALLDALSQSCSGNALLLSWATRWAIDEERVSDPPPTLNEIIRARLLSLRANERRLVELLAIAEYPLSARVLAHFAEEPLHEALGKLEAVGFTEPLSPRTPDEYHIPHTRLQRAIRAEITPDHERDLLMALLPVAVEEMRDSPELVGRLWSRLQHKKEARTWLLRAAHDAKRRLAFFKAAELYSEVLALSTDDQRPALHLSLGETYEHLGEMETAGDHLLEASRQLEAGRSIDLRTQAASLFATAGAEYKARTALTGVLEELNCEQFRGIQSFNPQWVLKRGGFRRYLADHDIFELTESLSASDVWHVRRIKVYHIASTVAGQINLAESLFYHRLSAALALRGAPLDLLRTVFGWELIFMALPGPPVRAHVLTLQVAFDALHDQRFQLHAIDQVRYYMITGTASLGMGRVNDAAAQFARTIDIFFTEYVRLPWMALTAAYMLAAIQIREMRFTDAAATADRLMNHVNILEASNYYRHFDLRVHVQLALARHDIAQADALLFTHRDVRHDNAQQLATFWWLNGYLERALYVGESADALREVGTRVQTLATTSLLITHYIAIELLFALGRTLLDARFSSASFAERLQWGVMQKTVFGTIAQFDTPQATQCLLALEICAALQQDKFSEALDLYARLQRICRDGTGRALIFGARHALAEHRLAPPLTAEDWAVLQSEGIGMPRQYLRTLIPSRAFTPTTRER